jgi:YesN/AraC family two-component response regulator
MQISRGNYFIIDYGAKHKYTPTGNSPLRILNCMFSPMVIDPSLKSCRHFKELINHYLINFDSNILNTNPTSYIYRDSNGEILKLLNRMNKEYTAKKIGYQEVLRGQFIELLINIIRNITITDTDVYDNDIVQYIIKHIQKHYAEKLSLQAIAEKYNYSLANASRIFKEKTGVSFQDYVQSARIKESCRLLTNTDNSIPQIALSVGYADTKFFNELFKRHLGITPRDYRKSHISTTIHT